MARLEAIDRTKGRKLYCQLAEVLRSQIERGNWEVGSQIPTEEHLCSLYDVSKATVRLAVEELVSLGFLKKFQGKGTFVRRRRPEHSIPLLTNLAEDDLRHEPSCLTRLVEYQLLKPTDSVRLELKLVESDNCHRLSTLAVTFDAPFRLQRSYLPYGLLPSALGADEAERAARGSLYAFFEARCGLRIHRVREMVEAVGAGEEDAALLELEPGSPVLRVRQLCSASGDVPIIFSELLFRTGTRPRAIEFERLTS